MKCKFCYLFYTVFNIVVHLNILKFSFTFRLFSLSLMVVRRAETLSCSCWWVLRRPSPLSALRVARNTPRATSWNCWVRGRRRSCASSSTTSSGQSSRSGKLVTSDFISSDDRNSTCEQYEGSSLQSYLIVYSLDSPTHTPHISMCINLIMEDMFIKLSLSSLHSHF